MPKAPENTRYMQHIAGRLSKTSLGAESYVSYEKVAEALNVSRQSIYAMLARPFRMWRIGELEKIADLLNWELNELIANALAYEEAVSKPGKAPERSKRKPGPKSSQPASQLAPSI